MGSWEGARRALLPRVGADGQQGGPLVGQLCELPASRPSSLINRCDKNKKLLRGLVSDELIWILAKLDTVVML